MFQINVVVGIGCGDIGFSRQKNKFSSAEKIFSSDENKFSTGEKVYDRAEVFALPSISERVALEAAMHYCNTIALTAVLTCFWIHIAA